MTQAGRSRGRLPLRHGLLALAVVAVWGTNFVVIKAALQALPPLFLGVLRFTLALLPAVLFIPRPAVPWRKLAAYGVFIGAAQFGMLYLALVLGGALAWSCGNQVARTMGRVQMLGVVVWSSAFALPPLVLLSWVVEGPARIAQGLAAADAGVLAAVAWQAAGNTLFGYAAWGWLLADHPAATITPMALGVPVFGIGASAPLLAEALPAWKLGAAALVMSGLALHLFALAKITRKS